MSTPHRTAWASSRSLPLLVFVLVATLSGGLVWHLERQRVASQRTVLLGLATDQARAIESRIDRLLSTTYLLAAALRKDRGVVIDFESIAHEILPFYPGITALSLSPGGVIRHIVPLESNRSVVGFDQLKDPKQSPEAFLARDTGQLTLAGPLNLVQGGQGVVGRLPVYFNDKQGERRFWGFVNVTIRFPDALDATGLESLQELGYRYELWRNHPETGQRQTIAASASVAALSPVDKTLRVPNAEWTLSLAPQDGWYSAPRLGAGAFAGLLLSALLAYLTQLGLALARHRAQLEQTVQERTATIATSQLQLAATLDAIPDLLFEIDDELRLHHVHTQQPELLMLPAHEILGRRVDEFLPPEALQAVRDALQEARSQGHSVGRQYPLAVPGQPGGAWFELSVANKPGATDGPARFIMIARDITERKRTEVALEAARERLALAFEASNDAPWDWSPGTGELYLSPQWWRMVGEPDRGTIQADAHFWHSYTHPDDFQRGVDYFREIVAQGRSHYSLEFRLRHRDGHAIPVLARALVHYDEKGRPVRVSGTHQDLTEIRRAQRRALLRTFLLNLLAQELTLPELLNRSVRQLEDSLPGSLCTILLLDDSHQHFGEGYGPSLPPAYVQAFRGLPIGPEVGSCGAAASARQPIYVGDITTHPNWAPYLDLATAAGLAACWSQPVITRDGQVAGTFAVYHRTPQMPQPEDAQLLEEAARFVAIAIERKQDEAALQLSAAVFDKSSEGFLITDAQQHIIKVNPAFTQITGYEAEEIMGKLPSYLASGHQSREFYADMWHELNTTGQWQGEVWNRRKDGQVYPEWLSITRVLDDEGLTRHYIAIFSDTSQRKAHEAQIRSLAHFDPLTGLANRTLLKDRVDHDLSQAKRNREPLTLMFLDLDHFKNINDSLGHHIGDLLLEEVARRITAVVREQDTVARLGGDEFVAVLPSTGAHDATHIARRLLEHISQPYQLEQHELNITPSIGLALYPEDGADYQTLYRCADTAMYRAKQQGRNGYSFFTAEMQASSIRTLQLDNALRRALEREQLSLHYQPQVSLDTGQVIGVEALLRWNHPEWGPVSPAEFVPVAESSGQILQIGEWVLRNACRQLKAWRDAGLPAMVMAVNLSAVQFRLPRLPELVMDILDEAQLPPDCLELELTESVAMHDPQGAVATMNRLHDKGILMSVDDFGTGYSSLSYLKRFRVYKLKIDMSFVRDMCVDPEDALIVGAIINLAQSLGLKTIAEGVETDEQLAQLRQGGCSEVQGYRIARPMPADRFEAWLRQQAASATPLLLTP
ncbi:EAL domain-containing protein [Hydrogenophaga sp. OTU3427]|uniref:EAL domain-containing protein n=1 Tax=Hydrogenophaga sp. OTU3427 TaxID=3043856 RepID=UPI00313E8498